MLLGALANISDKPLQVCGYILPPSLLGPACSGGQEPLVVVISVSQPAQRSGGPWPMPRTHLILCLQARFSGFLSSAGRPRSGELSCQQEELLRLDVVWPLLTASKHTHIDKRYMSSATDPTRSSDHYELLICACCVRAFRDAQQCTGHCAWTACSVPPIRELNDCHLFVKVSCLFVVPKAGGKPISNGRLAVCCSEGHSRQSISKGSQRAPWRCWPIVRGR